MPLLRVSRRRPAQWARSSRSSQALTSAVTRRPPRELAVEFEQGADGHSAVEAALLGEIADGAGAGAGGLAEDAEGAAVGVDDVDDHPHGGGFAGAVGADEAVDGALGDGERDVVHGGGGAEGFAHVEELDGIHGEDRITGRGSGIGDRGGGEQGTMRAAGGPAGLADPKRRWSALQPVPRPAKVGVRAARRGWQTNKRRWSALHRVTARRG